MALFAVPRYLGDDAKSAENDATEILAKLQNLAKKRKQESSTNLTTIELDEYKVNENTVAKKKRKTTKDSRTEDNTCSETAKTKHKTKKKSERKSVDNSCIEGEVMIGKPHQSNDIVSKQKSKKDTLDLKKHYDDDNPDEGQVDDDNPDEGQVDDDNPDEGQVDDDNQDGGRVVNETSFENMEESVVKASHDSSKETVDFDEMVDTEDKKQTDSEIGGFTVIGDIEAKHVEKVFRVLPDWLADPNIIHNDLRTKSLPLEEMCCLDNDLMQKLRENGITRLFPVQVQVIPVVLDGLRLVAAGYRPSDICCSSPTGSGKTLAFALPIIQALKTRVVCCVRALVVLPVQDLAAQVYKVFLTYCKGTKLKVGLLTGQKPLLVEQQSLVKQRIRGYHSMVDILVATPGRLVDHLQNTPGFDLTRLRFLVIDEADRMIEEIKQDWLSQVEAAVFTTTGKGQYGCFRELPGALTAANARKMHMPLQKLLFSATLSQNPEKLQQLNLFQPKLFTSVVMPTKNTKTAVDPNESKDLISDKSGEFIGKYTTPKGLSEQFVPCTAAEKPLVVLHFLHALKFRHVLCFTNSIEATHRLYLLVREFGDIEVREFSSKLKVNQRASIINKFSKGKLDLLICSDALARGMDVENVKYVISYDCPPYLKTYIHRIGRTARAGKPGTAFTLLETKEIYHFKKMVKEAGKDKVKEFKIPPKSLKNIVPAFQTALAAIPSILQAEKRKSLS